MLHDIFFIKLKKIKKWSNLHERPGIGWIERKTKFKIYYFPSYAEKTLKQTILSMPLSANLFRLESSIQKHARSRGTTPCGSAGCGAKAPKKIFFLSFELWSFLTPIFDEFSSGTQKIKIEEFVDYFSNTIQHTPHCP